ncbi:MAG: NUDIX hydrolase [Clostridia bacterium]|nr:NUDIX hydrolase [Clostridia bacterium]
MKFIGMEKVHDGRFIKRYNLFYETELGNKKTYEMISRRDLESFEDLTNSHSEAVVLIIHDAENSKVLLSKEYRMAVGGFVYNFPAGLIDPGESLEVAAKRELWEETGLNLTSIKDIWPEAYSAVGFANEKSQVIVGTAEGDFKPSTSDLEEIEAGWYTKSDVLELMKEGNFAARTQAYCALWAKI